MTSNRSDRSTTHTLTHWLTRESDLKRNIKQLTTTQTANAYKTKTRVHVHEIDGRSSSSIHPNLASGYFMWFIWSVCPSERITDTQKAKERERDRKISSCAKLSSEPVSAFFAFVVHHTLALQRSMSSHTHTSVEMNENLYFTHVETGKYTQSNTLH